jgi:hypothetical protein
LGINPYGSVASDAVNISPNVLADGETIVVLGLQLINERVDIYNEQETALISLDIRNSGHFST